MSKLKDSRKTQSSFRSLLFAGAMIFALNLTGCGGGGGGDSVSNTQSPPSPPPPVAFVPSITLFAGALGGAGNLDGLPGRLDMPISVAVDANNSIYVGDYNNCNIRKLSSSGLSVYMGGQSCLSYVADGSISPSTFVSSPYPQRIVSDRAGTIYLVKPNAPIQRIAADGSVSPSPIYVYYENRVAIDPDGTVFQVEPSGGVVYKSDQAGNRRILVSGLGTGSSLSKSTLGIALGGDGSIYIADADQQIIRKITPLGLMTTLAGTGTPGSIDGTASSADFNSPTGIAVDSSGNVYVGDQSNYTIRKITPSGVVSTLAGSSGQKGAADGKGATARFLDVGEITIDRADSIIVVDKGNSAIRRVSADGVVTTIAGVLPSRGSQDGSLPTSRFFSPSGLARDIAGNIYLGDTDNFIVRKISGTGEVSTFAGKAGLSGKEDGFAASARFASPQSIATDQQGNVYVADYSRIRKISAAGEVKLLADAGSAIYGGTFGQYSLAVPRFIRSLAVDSQSQLYAIERLGGQLGKVSASGSFTPIGFTPIGCAPSCVPLSVTGDSLGNLFVGSNGTITKIGADGTAKLVAGGVSGSSSQLLGWKDGIGSDARFSGRIDALAVDNNGNIFVCDTGNHTIRKITPSGVVTTIAGKSGIAGTTLGPLPGLLNAPRGIVIDNAGNLYVTTEDAVVKITLS
jgi:NHL repeat